MARKLTNQQRMAICASIGTGLNDSAIARQLGTTRQAVGRLRKELRNTPLVPDFDVASAKQRITVKAYNGLEAALDDGSDNYKRGGISVQALKGVGEFAPDQGNVNVLNMLQSMPVELKNLIDQEIENANSGTIIEIPANRE